MLYEKPVVLNVPQLFHWWKLQRKTGTDGSIKVTDILKLEENFDCRKEWDDITRLMLET
jgi:hypothetical protein